MPINDDDLDNWFIHHPPTPEQTRQYERIRRATWDFAIIIADATPPSTDQTTAICKVREAMMTANAAIACGGR